MGDRLASDLSWQEDTVLEVYRAGFTLSGVKQLRAINVRFSIFYIEMGLIN